MDDNNALNQSSELNNAVHIIKSLILPRTSYISFVETNELSIVQFNK